MFPVRRCRYSGAEVLSLLFLRHPSLVRRSAVLEVGAGIGLAAIAAATAMRGEEETQEREETAASRGLLCVTDGEEDAVQLSRVNLHLHCRRLLGGTDQGEGGEGTGEDEDGLLTQRAPLPLSSSAVATSVRVFPFDESSRPPPPSAQPPSLPSLPLLLALRVQWSEEGRRLLSSELSSLPSPVRCSFSVVYGSDVLYARTSAPSLLSFALPLLAPGGHLLLAHTPRVAGLRAELRRSCVERDLRLAYLPLSAFLGAEEVRGRGWTEVDVAVVARAAEWTAVDAAYGSRGLTLEQRSEGERRADEADAEDETTALRGLRTHEEEEEEEDDDG